MGKDQKSDDAPNMKLAKAIAPNHMGISEEEIARLIEIYSKVEGLNPGTMPRVIMAIEAEMNRRNSN